MERPTVATPLDNRLREGLARLGMPLRSDDSAREREVGLNPTQMAILEALEAERTD